MLSDELADAREEIGPEFLAMGACEALIALALRRHGMPSVWRGRSTDLSSRGHNALGELSDLRSGLRRPVRILRSFTVCTHNTRTSSSLVASYPCTVWAPKW